jgi:hypothetical protein
MLQLLTTLMTIEYSLDGPIPTEFGQMTSLVSLRLDQNSLTGTFPPELGNLRNLKTILVDSNSLTGFAPQEVCDLRTEALTKFIVDCVDPRTSTGIDCPEPSCCTFCRDSRG